MQIIVGYLAFGFEIAAAAELPDVCAGAGTAEQPEPRDVCAGAEQAEPPDVCAGRWAFAFSSSIYLFMRAICFASFGTWVIAGPVSASNGLRIAEKS